MTSDSIKASMTMAEVVGERLRIAREGTGMTQEQLGLALEPYLGRPWSRQAVSSAERGGREFTAAELAVLAEVLDQHVAWLLTPPLGAGHIRTPGGRNLLPEEMWRRFQSPSGAVDGNQASLTRWLKVLSEAQEQLADSITQFREWVQLTAGPEGDHHGPT